MDVAVCKVLKNMHCPVKIDIERLGHSEYMIDQKLVIKIINGEVIVRAGNNYEPLESYLRKLYEPFYIMQRKKEGYADKHKRSQSAPSTRRFRK